MEQKRIEQLSKLALYRLRKGSEYLKEKIIVENIEKSFISKFAKSLNEESEIPGFEDKPMPFDKFKNENYVVVMTDIRKSVNIINGTYGVRNMFLIFYSYAAVVANIIDDYKGTATEFLGDGVLNLFGCDDGIDETISNAYSASLDIMHAKTYILNPIYSELSLPNINIGIGLDYGYTIVTRFGYKSDNDLKAFGKCIHNASRLCKGENTILVSDTLEDIWPEGEGGLLKFKDTYDADGKHAFIPYTL